MKDGEMKLILDYSEKLKKYQHLSSEEKDCEIPDKTPLVELHKKKRKVFVDKLNKDIIGDPLGLTTYLNKIERSEIPCAIYDFLESVKGLIESENPENISSLLFDSLEEGIKNCNYPKNQCPCPADG